MERTHNHAMAFPEQRSTFDVLLRSRSLAAPSLGVSHVRTSAGYNTTRLAGHVLGVHLGAPVVIAHWREQIEALHRFCAGEMVFTPAGPPVHYAHAEPVEAMYITIDPSALRETAASMGLPEQSLDLHDNFGASDPAIASLGLALLRELRAPGPGSRMLLDAIMVQLAVHVVRRFAVDDTPPALCDDDVDALRVRLRPAIEYMHAHFGDDIALADLAGTVHLSPFYFCRLFKRAFGVSPHRYLIRRRVEAAGALLQSSRLTLTEIASTVGFADQSHLIRHYKRLTGTTPRAGRARTFT